MTVAVLAKRLPPAPPPPVDPGWDRTVVDWTAPDGTVWHLTSPQGGVFLLRAGLRGLGEPKRINYRDKSPAVHGAQYRGTIYEPREVHWIVYVYSEGSTAEWVELDRAFWDGLHGEGTLRVTIPGISSRTLKLRLEGDDDWVPELDPAFFGWTKYSISLQADQPLWEGEPVTLPWEAGVQTPFFDGVGIFTISPSGTLSEATINNPGDEEGWGIWTVHGPTAAGGATITIDGHVTEIPIELDAGERVVLDTRPTEQTAIKIDATGVETDVFHLLGEYDPAPIKPKGQAQLELVATSTGHIDLTMTPLYLRAW